MVNKSGSQIFGRNISADSLLLWQTHAEEVTQGSGLNQGSPVYLSLPLNARSPSPKDIGCNVKNSKTHQTMYYTGIYHKISAKMSTVEQYMLADWQEPVKLASLLSSLPHYIEQITEEQLSCYGGLIYISTLYVINAGGLFELLYCVVTWMVLGVIV